MYATPVIHPSIHPSIHSFIPHQIPLLKNKIHRPPAQQRALIRNTRPRVRVEAGLPRREHGGARAACGSVFVAVEGGAEVCFIIKGGGGGCWGEEVREDEFG